MTENNLRQLALEADDLKVATFEWKGKQYAIKPPTIMQQKQAKLAAKTKDGHDENLMGILLLVGCIIDPATGANVFQRQDVDTLMNQPSTPNSFLGKALTAFASLAEVKDKLEGFFEIPASDS